MSMLTLVSSITVALTIM